MKQITADVAEKLLRNGLVCPKCRSGEIGFDVRKQEWDCQDCGHKWGE